MTFRIPQITIRLPIRFLLFLVYTVAVLGASFGISYAVFEVRGDGDDTKLESLDRGIGNLAGQLDDVRAEIGELQVEATLADDRRSTCDAVILRTIALVLNAQTGQLSAAELITQAAELEREREFFCEGVSLAP